MNNLFYVNKLISDIIAEHVDADGVITEEGMKKLLQLDAEKNDIIDNIIKAHKNYTIMNDGIDAEINRLKLRKETYSKSQASLMTALTPYLTEGDKIETPEYILKWTTSSPLVGLDGFDAELEFADEDSQLYKFVKEKVVEPTYSFDMPAIKKALKNESTAKELPAELYINTTKNPKIT
jgi:hypothetical protein